MFKRYLFIFAAAIIAPSAHSLSFACESVICPDSLRPAESDSLQPKSKSLEYRVEYEARDSISFDLETQRMFLYGDAKVFYGETAMEAEYIEISMKTSELLAKGGIDSVGQYFGKPDFKDGGQGFGADSMKYNFKTKRGKIYDAKTQEGDGFIHGNHIKKVDDDILYIKDGKYTTCSLDDPHFHIESKKLKIIKNDKIVTGPAHLRVADIPTPLMIPFGFFPNKRGQSSGVVIPTYGESPRQGFFLNNGGYYWGFSDYADLRLLGDIYSRGSWAVKGDVNYKVRYRYGGNLNVQYSRFKESEPEFPDYTENNNFFIRWRHTQDPKARPNSDFSADVNAGSANNFRNNLNTTTTDYLSNTFKSNITYRRSFPLLGKASSFSFNASHDQNTRDSTINVNLPQLQYSLTERWYPLQRKKVVGKKRWYEEIGFNYTADLQNRLVTKDDSLLFDWDTQQDRIQNGMRHTVPINLPTFKILKYLNFSPRVSYMDVWYLETYRQRWDSEQGRVMVDTVNKFDRFAQYAASGSLTTKLYGMYAFKKSKTAIRHVLTPTIGATFKPDFSKPNFGYYENYVRTDTAGIAMDTVSYTRFNGIYGAPTKGDAGIITFGLINNLEMKMRSEKDTVTGFKKITLLENFALTSSYNLFADSMRLAPISMNARTYLWKNVSLNFSGTLNPYMLDSAGTKAIDGFLLTEGNGNIARLTDAKLAVTFSLKGKQTEGTRKANEAGSQDELNSIMANPNLYLDWTVPWSLNVNYNLMYSKPLKRSVVTNSVTFNGDFSLTPKWKIGFNSGYDLQTKKFTQTTLDIYRDLHCWEFKFHIIPFGMRQSYRFDIQVKAPILQDLKISRRREWYDRGSY